MEMPHPAHPASPGCSGSLWRADTARWHSRKSHKTNDDSEENCLRLRKSLDLFFFFSGCVLLLQAFKLPHLCWQTHLSSTRVKSPGQLAPCDSTGVTAQGKSLGEAQKPPGLPEKQLCSFSLYFFPCQSLPPLPNQQGPCLLQPPRSKQLELLPALGAGWAPEPACTAWVTRRGNCDTQGRCPIQMPQGSIQ